jgi:hypothetical protein
MGRLPFGISLGMVGLAVSLVVGAAACASTERSGFDGTPDPAPSQADAGDSPSTTGTFGEGGATEASAPPVTSTDPVDVVFTADNAYAFGWGDAASLANYESRPNTVVAGDIFNCPVTPGGTTCTSPSGCGPESYVVPATDAPPTAYLYVVAWSDESTTQGALGQFKRGVADTLYTGDHAWEVCATGVEHDPTSSSDPGPTKADVEAKIALCNSGDAAVPSHGWVDKNGPVTADAIGNLAVGEDNSRGRATDTGGAPSDGVFPITCQKNTDGTAGIDAEAHWMWYQPPGFTTDEAFTNNASNATQTYLIFRVKSADIPTAPVN